MAAERNVFLVGVNVEGLMVMDADTDTDTIAYVFLMEGRKKKGCCGAPNLSYSKMEREIV